MSDNVCIQCGIKRSQFQNTISHNCDGCGAWVCPSCFEKMEVAYTPNRTQFGIVGYLKLCDNCKEKYQHTKITEHPYLG